MGRPRGIVTCGVDEPNAFVAVLRPWFEPIVAATMVELVDGLVCESRAGKGDLSDAPAGLVPRPVEHRHLHVELLVVGSGHEGRYPAEQAALVSMDPDTFFVPPYVGPNGWVGVRIALVDPGEMRELITEAWRLTAGVRLVKAYDERTA